MKETASKLYLDIDLDMDIDLDRDIDLDTDIDPDRHLVFCMCFEFAQCIMMNLFSAGSTIKSDHFLKRM